MPSKKNYRRAWEERAREEAHRKAESLAISALLDHRIPDSGRLVRDMGHPIFAEELRALGSDPTGASYTTEVVRRYVRIIAKRTTGGAQAVKQHFTELIGPDQGEKLGIRVARLKMYDRPGPDGDMTVDIKLKNHDAIAIARYLASPEHLNLSNLPQNPFGNPRLALVMESIKKLDHKAQWAPEHPYTLSAGPTVHDLKYQIRQRVAIAAHEMSRAMPGNAAREAALKAMRLADCLDIYTPRVVRRTGRQGVAAYETHPGSGRPVLVTKQIAVFKTVPGTSDEPTRYWPRDAEMVAAQFLNWYAR